MNYYQLFVANKKIIAFLILFTFFSGFGQTYVLSLYIPGFLSELDISRTFFSTLYSIATVISGVTIVFAGKIIDKISVKYFALIVVAGLVCANILASFSFNVITVFFAVFMLRFFGQGLSTHTSFTVAGKYFNTARGKALSFAYLGFPLSEGLLPNLALISIVMLGWRQSFQLTAFLILIILLPLTFFLLRKFSGDAIVEAKVDNQIKPGTEHETHIQHPSWGQRKIISNNLFYFIAPTPFLIGFILTALFFYQTFLAEYKQWNIEWMTFSILFYAISSFMASLLTGPLVDRYSARSVYPFAGLPIIFGLLVFVFFDHAIAASFYWFFVGLTAGMNSTVANALYAESYGVKNLGGVRSLFSFVMIAGTASGPVVYSLLMDAGIDFSSINIIISCLFFLNCIMLVFRLRRV